MTRKFPLFILFLFAFYSSVAQEYFVQKYTMKNGLPNNQLHNIIQAKDNTLWLTTFYGLTQFDGTNFTVFTEDDGLISNHIFNVFEDSKGRIWVCPWNRTGINRIENGKVTTFKDSILNEKWMMHTAYEDKNGIIWFFGNNEVFKYENDSFKLIYKSQNKKEYHHPNQLSVINDNELYLTQQDNGIIRVTLNPFKITRHINNKSHGINNICYSILKDRDNIIWLGCYGAIYSYENDKITEYKVPIEFDKCRIWDIDEDKDGYLWLTTYGGGIVRWDKKDEFIVIDEKKGLSDDYCYSLLIDNENNKWVATDIAGLNKIGDFSFQYYTMLSGLKSDLVFGFAQNKEGDIIVGTDKGFSIIKDNKVDTVIHEDYSIFFLTQKNDEIWFASDKGYGILKDNYELKNYDPDNKYNYINTEENIVCGLSRIKKDFKDVLYREFLIIPSAFYFDDVLYFATNYGLLQKKNEKISSIKQLPLDDFPEISISYKISKDEVLVSNPNELVYIKNLKDSLKIKRFSAGKLGGVNRIFSILLDGNDLWLGAHYTLAKINFQELIQNDKLIMEKYDVSSGFLEGLVAPGAIFKDKQGAIWIGLSTGAVKFNPKLVQKNKLEAKLKINKIKLFSREINIRDFENNGKIYFDYNQNHLTFDFQAVSLSKPKNIRIKYRLLGLSDKWSEPLKNQPISYPFLNPGTYTFEFIASNGEGVWTKKPLQFSFEITPPFWKTSWFIFLILSIIAFAIFSLFYRQKRKALRIQKEQEKFTQEIIEAQEEERKRISKGLHDGIGQRLLLIKNALHSGKMDGTEKMVSTTIEEVRSISRKLHPFQLEKFGLTKSLESMIEELDQSFDEIIFTEEIDTIDHLFSKEQELNIYRIIQECFNNILKHSNASAARLVVEKNGGEIKITILDNGKGFDLNKNKALFKSLGLKSIRERVKYLNGTVEFDSKINQGTRITIIIAHESN